MAISAKIEHSSSITLPAALGTRRPLTVRALLLGERIATNRFEPSEPLARVPLTICVDGGGVAVLFRYGAVVLMNVSHEAEIALLDRLMPIVGEPFEPRESDELRVDVRPDVDEQIDLAGTVLLKEITLERLQLIADALAKSVGIGFDRAEPMAEALRRDGRIAIADRPLLRQIGSALLVQYKMVGRVETGEKPELLWDHPELDRFYARLAEEYELRERSRALDHKQDVILRTSETLLGLAQERSNRRLEWYVLLLIVAELAVALYSVVKGMP
jgi:required for meiotic nuclear division protein 1